MRVAVRRAAFWPLLILCLISGAAAQNRPAPDFTRQCRALVVERYNASTSDPKLDLDAPFLVGPDGPRGGRVSLKGAWGVSFETCKQICGKIGIPFEFSRFSTSMTQWLLPWVILTAQLPYETSGPFNDLLSFLLAVGSPAFIMFGLVLTMLNRIRIAEEFENLYSLAKDPKIKEHHPHVVARLHEAHFAVAESQQSPMRAYDGDGWLGSLLFHERNAAWWTGVEKDLSNTKRRATISLVVQIVFAFIAWLFTVIEAFDNLGNVVIGLSIASSSIWVWLVPITSGWVAVGTQAKKGAVAEAFQGHAYRAKFTGSNAEMTLHAIEAAAQNGITTHSGINPPFAAGDQRLFQARRESCEPTHYAQAVEEQDFGTIELEPILSQLTQWRSLRDPDLFNDEIPKWFSFSLAGDESKEGPIYNYARIFTHAQFATTIQSGFREGLRALLHGEVDTATHNLSMLCGFQKPIKAYPEWEHIESKVWRDIFVATVMALFLQWGTSGPAIMLDYLTMVSGLGCRSFAHILYAVNATVSLFLLFIASLLSHALMLRYQDNQAREASATKVPSGILPFLFVLCRLLGTCIASINAVWLILSTALELSGVFDNCWCNSDYLGLGSNAWVLIFKDGPALAQTSVALWVGAVVFSSIVAFIACVAIWMGCKKNR